MGDQEIIIHTDGGSRGNPGPAACAFVVEEKNKIIFEGYKFLGKATNNVAEYNGVILALEWINRESGIVNQESGITFLMDSELIVRQLNGIYRVKDEELQKLFFQVKKLIVESKTKIIFQHVPREKNKEADLLVNQELDRNIS